MCHKTNFNSDRQLEKKLSKRSFPAPVRLRAISLVSNGIKLDQSGRSFVSHALGMANWEKVIHGRPNQHFEQLGGRIGRLRFCGLYFCLPV